MCDPFAAPRLSSAEIADITSGLRALAGNWTIFPHVGSMGEVTLLLAPEAWEGGDTALLVQREADGISLLLSEADSLIRIALLPDAAGVVAAAGRAAWRQMARMRAA
ncbi:hypothetical protein [Roseomonas sp. USHLN139]|uniref:hypothetical protein n=1 Tax=Roseomonas sp. USHLN139 TaxID=3081298 RepID=UPI003B026630